MGAWRVAGDVVAKERRSESDCALGGAIGDNYGGGQARERDCALGELLGGGREVLLALDAVWGPPEGICSKREYTLSRF